jgi:hypothetical protein
MKNQKIVATLEQSKRLKKLGFPQETAFMYVGDSEARKFTDVLTKRDMQRRISAPTLHEMLLFCAENRIEIFIEYAMDRILVSIIDFGKIDEQEDRYCINPNPTHAFADTLIKILEGRYEKILV